MKKIKSVKYRVKLSYRNTFIFDEIGDASAFISRAVRHAEEPDDIESFEISTIVEYYPTLEEIKQQLNEEFGKAVSSDKEEEDESN